MDKDNLDFCQGARCGSANAVSRRGYYVNGEECDLSWQTAEEMELGSADREEAFAKGFRYGYRLTVEGEDLPEEVRIADFPT